MGLFRCRHDWHVSDISNILQLDAMGYPLRLCIVKCSKCGKTEQMWIDVSVDRLKELETGESFLLEWTEI